MTGSIAFGMSVDEYPLPVRLSVVDKPAIRRRLQLLFIGPGNTIFEAAAIASLGMLALMFSSFTPTARFGFLMAVLLWSAAIGCLVQLPAILAILPDSEYEMPRPSPCPTVEAVTAEAATEDRLRQAA